MQFTITIFLVIGTLVVDQQLDYFQNKKLGFSKEQVIVVKTPQPLNEQSKPFKEALAQGANILSVSGSHILPGRSFNNIGFRAEASEQGITLNLCLTDFDFQNTLNLEMATGRFFSRQFPTDSSAMIINETAANLIGWDDPIGKSISGLGNKFSVVGVVKDFHYESLHMKVRPMAMLMLGGTIGWDESFISIRTKTDDIARTLQFIENTWKAFAAGRPLEYSFLDDDYNALYLNEQQTSEMFMIFSSLAIFIASLGLLGLASFISEYRTKEISIRKVLGARVSGLVFMLSKQFTKWVVLANLVAWPLAWFAMNQWLDNFAYRIELDWWVFVLSGSFALCIAMLTVSYQSIKTARTNPAVSLRAE